MGRQEVLERLVAITERQLDAAKRLESAQLDQLNLERSDLIFELQLASQDPLPDEIAARQSLAREAHKLRSIEQRLAKVAGCVVAALDAVVPRPETQAKRYRRSGRLA